MEPSYLREKNFIQSSDSSQLTYGKNSIKHPENLYHDFEWIDELVQEEQALEQMGVITEENEQYYCKMLDQASIEMMSLLRRKMDLFVLHYNNQIAQLIDQKYPIKIFKLSNSVNDFMLYRQSLKLVISRKAVDCISTTFSLQKKILTPISNNNYNGEDFFNKESYIGGQSFQEDANEFMAQIGAFQTIQWCHQGREFNPLMAVKGLFKRFVRKSMN